MRTEPRLAAAPWDLQRRLAARFGPVPRARLPAATLEMLYRKVTRLADLPPDARAALKALELALAPDALPGEAGAAPAAAPPVVAPAAEAAGLPPSAFAAAAGPAFSPPTLPAPAPAAAAAAATATQRELDAALGRLDPATRAATVALAARLPALVRAAVEICASAPPGAGPPPDFPARLVAALGGAPLPRQAFPPGMLAQFYWGNPRVAPAEPAVASAALAALEAALATAPAASAPAPAAASSAPLAAGDGVDVVCNGNYGRLELPSQVVLCRCGECRAFAARAGLARLELTPAEFERHSGARASKKWRHTIRVAGPGAPEGGGVVLGAWLDERGVPARLARVARAAPIDALPLATGVRELGAGEAPGRRAPGGRPWLGAVAPKPERVGAAFQAALPPYGGAAPAGGGAARAGARAPGGAAALASAAGPERAAAAAAPRDAVDDAWAPRAGAGLAAEERNRGGGTVGRGSRSGLDLYRNGGTPAAAAAAAAAAAGDSDGSEGGAVAAADEATGRHGRRRKQPGWMKNTVDPNAVLGGRALVSRDGAAAEAAAERPPPRRGAPPRPLPRFAGAAPPAHYAPPAEDDAQAAKRARLDGADASLTALVDAALEAGHVPEIAGWRVTDANQLALTIQLGSVRFSGALAPARALALGALPAACGVAAAPTPAAAPAAPRAPGAAPGAGTAPGAGAALAAAAAAAAALAGPPPPPPPPPPPRSGDFPRAGPVFRLPSGKTLALQREEPPAPGGAHVDERHAAGAAEYERLLAAGPPDAAVCALCHREGEPESEVDDAARGPGGRAAAGLGPLMLVRASAIASAWAHDQCARWSPEVHDPRGDGMLEGVKEAVRRGRMLRCRACNGKGATLGCLKKTCRHSYHLPCARETGCLTVVHPYVVACPEHVDDLPDGLSARFGTGKRPPRASGRRPPAGGGGGGALDALDALGAVAEQLGE